MTVFHYNDTPTPVGLPIYMNSVETAYELGIFDGAIHEGQYPDEPEAGIAFESPEAAKRWLDAATTALMPYIVSGDRRPMIPDATGWSFDTDAPVLGMHKRTEGTTRP